MPVPAPVPTVSTGSSRGHRRQPEQRLGSCGKEGRLAQIPGESHASLAPHRAPQAERSRASLLWLCKPEGWRIAAHPDLQQTTDNYNGPGSVKEGRGDPGSGSEKCSWGLLKGFAQTSPLLGAAAGAGAGDRARRRVWGRCSAGSGAEGDEGTRGAVSRAPEPRPTVDVSAIPGPVANTLNTTITCRMARAVAVLAVPLAAIGG